jgi:hypothetical protein
VVSTLRDKIQEDLDMAKQKPSRRRSQKNRKQASGGTLDLERRAEKIYREIEELSRDLLHCRYHGQEAHFPPLKLELSVSPFQKSEEGTSGGSEIIGQFLSQMENAFRPEGFKEGRIYCYLCESADCTHSEPTSPKAVFVGYSTNGKPDWEDFSNFLLHQSESRADQLYEKRPLVIAIPQHGDDLHANQLSAFGRTSPTHHILGQVVSGYYKESEKETGGRWAVSLQAVEYRMRDGRPRLDLNVVSGALGSAGLSGILTQQNDEGLYATVARARGMIGSIGERSINRRTGEWYSRKFESNVYDVLQNLARFLERNDHHHRSRTRHARIERTRSDRPISSALSDTERARDTDVFIDSRNSTIVVIGPHNRTHVFNAEGRLVTSINYEGDEIKRKLRIRHWTPATAEETQKFRRAVAAFRR